MESGEKVGIEFLSHDYYMPPHVKKTKLGKYFATVPRWLWKRMQEIAIERDINKGGLFDCRGGAINIWVSPEDKPKDYEFPITQGALKYPRNYLATIYYEETLEDRRGIYDYDYVILSIRVTNYEREDKARDDYLHGRISCTEMMRQVKLARTGTPAEWEWAWNKAVELLKEAERTAQVRRTNKIIGAR